MAEIDTREAAATPLSGEQVATPPSGPPLAGGKQVAVLLGPYRGSVLVLPEAEADQAIDDHWAAEAVTAPFDEGGTYDHGALSDAERAAAEDAAQAWADAQQGGGDDGGDGEPAPEGAAVRRGPGRPRKR